MGSANPQFPTTSWTLIRKVQKGDEREATAAMEEKAATGVKAATAATGVKAGRPGTANMMVAVRGTMTMRAMPYAVVMPSPCRMHSRSSAGTARARLSTST